MPSPGCVRSENRPRYKVFISGVFFTGPPHRILLGWQDGKVQLLVSAAILDEYHRVKDELASQFPDVDLVQFLELLTVQAEVIDSPLLPPVIQEDPSDDRFLECAVAGKADCIISGDKHLLKLSTSSFPWERGRLARPGAGGRPPVGFLIPTSHPQKSGQELVDERGRTRFRILERVTGTFSSWQPFPGFQDRCYCLTAARLFCWLREMAGNRIPAPIGP